MLSKSISFHKIWDTIIAFAVTLPALVIPLKLVLKSSIQDSAIYIDIVVTLIFGLDIFFNFIYGQYRRMTTIHWMNTFIQIRKNDG